MQAVKFIGRRPWADNLYGSRLTFEQGQIRKVPADLARKLLRHRDQFEAGEQADAPADKAKAGEPLDDTAEILARAALEQQAAAQVKTELQDLFDRVNQMEKDALIEFANTHYRMPLDKRFGEQKLREQVIGLIDQYGAV